MKPDLRVYAIGDVHGCLDKLLALEELIKWDAKDAEQIQIVMLGDYVDRGPQSREVLEHIIKSQAIDGRVALIGNHDLWMPFHQLTEKEFMNSCRYGLVTTLHSYGIDVRGWEEAKLRAETTNIVTEFQAVAPAHHRIFIETAPLQATFGDYFFAHAGLRPGITLSDQEQDDLTFIREPFLSSKADHGCVVIHGHTPVEEVELRANRIGIDTGAVFGGRLTALALEGDQRWVLQV
jgi:serine/threonine protein phosphatase 1